MQSWCWCTENRSIFYYMSWQQFNYYVEINIFFFVLCSKRSNILHPFIIVSEWPIENVPLYSTDNNFRYSISLSRLVSFSCFFLSNMYINFFFPFIQVLSSVSLFFSAMEEVERGRKREREIEQNRQSITKYISCIKMCVYAFVSL